MTALRLRKMLSHLAVLLLVNTVYISLRRIGKPASHVDYDIHLVKQQTQEVLIYPADDLAFHLGLFRFFVGVYRPMEPKHSGSNCCLFSFLLACHDRLFAPGARRCNNKHECLLVVLGINCFTCLQRIGTQTSEWRLIENSVELILLGKNLEYDLPVKLHGVKPNSPQIYKYLNERKWS